VIAVSVMKSKPVRKRLDILLVERGLAESIQKAQAMILAGEVRVAGTPADKAGTAVAEDQAIEVSSRAQKYASRSGVKLEGALEDFGIDPVGQICVDVGSSTGGFTDCLLQHGAARVYAIDVNIDQLAWKLRQDARVICIERNARELVAADIPELADLITVDVSFISLDKVLSSISQLAQRDASLLLLVKPQFELAREDVAAGGVVTDPQLHEKAIASVRGAALAAGLNVLGVRPSHLKGAEGNQEYFLHARKKTMG
jgi:23S rRNA (cytidine1920-2'-O)/16S rRNA (cytidine1409-2'-O)-methyltransferase